MNPYPTTVLDMVNPYCDDTNKVLSFTPVNNSAPLSQAIMSNWVQGGGAYIIHNMTEKIQWCKFNSNALASCIPLGNHTFLDISRVSSVNYPNIMFRRRDNIFSNGGGGGKAPKTYLGITHYAKLPSTDPLNFNLPGYIFCSTAMETPDSCRNISRGDSVEEFQGKEDNIHE